MANKEITEGDKRIQPKALIDNKRAVKLNPLDLNNIKLDVKHTILTPEYLDSINNSEGKTTN